MKTAFFGIYLYLSFVALGTFLSWMLPGAVDSYPSWLLGLSTRVAELIPSIKQFEMISEFSIVTRVFLAVEWLAVPLLIIVISSRKELVKPREKLIRGGEKLKTLLALGLIAVVVVWYPLVMQVGPDLSGGSLKRWAIRWTSQSRTGLGVIGSTTIFAISYWISLSISYLRALLKRTDK